MVSVSHVRLYESSTNWPVVVVTTRLRSLRILREIRIYRQLALANCRRRWFGVCQKSPYYRCDGVLLSDQQSFQNQTPNQRELARRVQISREVLDGKLIAAQSKLNSGSYSDWECDSASETTH